MLRLCASLLSLILAPPAIVTADPYLAESLSCSGITQQSGLVRCHGPASLDIDISGPDGEVLRSVRTDETGTVFIGLRQHDPSTLRLEPAASRIPPSNESQRTGAFGIMAGPLTSGCRMWCAGPGG